MEDILKRSVSPSGRLTPAYCCTLVVSGLILRLATLTDDSSRSVHAMLQVHNLYVQVLAVLFLLYLLVAVHHYLGKDLHLEDGRQGTRTATSLYLNTVSSHQDHQEAYDSTVLPVVYHGEYMNGLLRFLLVVLSLCSLVREVLSITVSYQFYDRCFRWYHMSTSLLRMGLYMLQTGTLIKHDRIFINFRYRTVQLGLGHVMAANLVTWYNDVIQKSHDDLQPQSEYLIRTGLNESISQVVCLQAQEAPLSRAGDYLYTLTVQYSLLGAVLVYRMYSRTGTTPTHPTPRPQASLRALLGRTRGQVGHTMGVICGLCLLVAAGAGAISFIVYHETQDPLAPTATSVIYLSTDISCNLIGVIVCVVILGVNRKLRFMEVKDAVFEDSLLTFTYVGAFGFTFLVLIGQITAAEGGLDIVAGFSLVASILSIIQSSLQLATLKDALWRTPYTAAHAASTPGRGWVVLLLSLNLSLWLMNILELQSLWLKSEPHQTQYGPLVWTVGTNLLLPLAALYRLHAALTLGAIWCTAGEPVREDVSFSIPRQVERVSGRLRRMDMARRWSHRPGTSTRY